MKTKDHRVEDIDIETKTGTNSLVDPIHSFSIDHQPWMKMNDWNEDKEHNLIDL